MSKNNETSRTTRHGNDFIADVMHRFYQQIAKEHKVHTDRIMLAITDNGRFFQAYVTNEQETELRYLQDYAIPNGA